MRRFILSLSALVVPMALIACGSSGGSTGGAGGTGGSTTSSTTGTGGTGTTSTGTGGSTTSSTTGTGGSATTSTGTGGAPGGACTNQADLAVVQSKDVATIAGTCGKNNIGNETATKKCIKDETNLSDPCVGCFYDTIQCTISKCLTQCLADPAAQACKDCRAQNCDPAFYACSGLPPQN